MQIPLPDLPEGLEADLLEDIANRADLSSAVLPSAIFYTFVNTHQTLNCVAFSGSGSMVVGEPFLVPLHVESVLLYPCHGCTPGLPRDYCRCLLICQAWAILLLRSTPASPARAGNVGDVCADGDVVLVQEGLQTLRSGCLT